jgi:hypothetical protein
MGQGFDDGMSVFSSHDRHLVMGTAARDAKDGSLRPPRLAWATALEGMPFGAKCAIDLSGPLSRGKFSPDEVRHRARGRALRNPGPVPRRRDLQRLVKTALVPRSSSRPRLA